MKYQEALNRIAKYCNVNNGSMLEDDLKTLQELVDKETPMQPDKIIDDTYEYYFCPRCESQIIENIAYYTEWEGVTTLHIVYCPSCGQALKWKDCY